MIFKQLVKWLRGDFRWEHAWIRLDWMVRKCFGLREHNRSYFERIYREFDPWNYALSEYEQEKYQKTLDRLPLGTGIRVLEAGCSIGVFTQMLAPRVGLLDAFDLSPTAVERAKLRCKNFPHVRWAISDLLKFKGETYDLVICAEMLYYLWEPKKYRIQVANKLSRWVKPDGCLMVVLGGDGINQDWISVLEETGCFKLKENELIEDPRRHYRMIEFRRKNGII